MSAPAAETRRVAPPRAEVQIDLAAYRDNIATLASRLTDGAQLWAVVKANAYGHDVDHIAQAAIAAGARRLCVATLSEARQLRVAGVRVPLLIMGPLDAPSMQRAIDIDVSFAVVSRPMLEALSSLNTTTRPARVHLKIDTGMGRWGIHLDAARSAIDVVTSHDGVELEGIMTHFATADEADLTFTEQQLASFQPIVAHARAVAPRVIAHAANSAATLRAPKSHLDAVRCGVATYGLDPCQLDASTYGLKPVIALRSHVAEVRTLTPGESAGYGRTFIATDHVRVAEVPIGYADGLRRALSNQGHALIRGAARAMVGNISMDHVTLLVSDDVAPGDLVTLIGRDGDVQVSAEDHARWAATINYEITCGLAGEPRLLRTHVGARR